ncbi:MAG: inositol monophosphatase family protein [Casimicrobiaceae bacterium]
MPNITAMMDDRGFELRTVFAQRLARDAGALARRYFERELDYTAESKGILQDWVSVADRSVELLCRSQLAAAFPDDAMLGEETGGDVAQSTWIVDPIDGTLNFVHGVRYWCVSIAYVEDGACRIGAVHDPLHDELFFAVAGRGATVNGRAMRVSSCASLDRALVMHGYVARQDLEAHLRLRRDLIAAGSEVKDHGAGALMLAHVAAGRFDAYVEPHMHPWDAAAGLLLVEEAGGRVLPYPGPRGLRAGGAVIAAAPAIYEPLASVAGWT